MAFGYGVQMTTSVGIAQLILYVLMIFLGAYLLQFVAKLFQGKDKGYNTALRVSLTLAVAGIIWTVLLWVLPSLAMLGLLVAIAVLVWAFFLIKNNYKTDGGQAILIEIVWIIAYAVVFAILSAILVSFL